MTEANGEGQGPKASQMGKMWKRLQGFSKRTYVVIGLVAAIIGIGVGLPAWPYWPRHVVGITFTNPLPGTFTPEPCTFTATGRGAPPAGQALMLSNQQQGTGDKVNSTQNFAVVAIGPETWHVDVQIGNSRTPGGTPYELTVWLANADWIKYLTQVTPSQRQWWETLGSPP